MKNVIKRARAIKTILSNYDEVVDTINWLADNGVLDGEEYETLNEEKERYEQEIKNLMEL